MDNAGLQTALVTGASGFIGKHLTRRLIQLGWRVHLVTRSNSQLPNYLEFTQATNHCYSGQTSEMHSILAAAKPNVVFHLASHFLAEHKSQSDAEKLIASNITFAAALLEAMKETGVRHFINTGTVWQHYQGDNYEPVNFYAATKQAFEDILAYYVSAHDFRACTLKLADTYGPDDDRPKLLNLLRRSYTENQPLSLSPGQQKVDLVHVDDVVDAYLLAAKQIQESDFKGHTMHAVTTGKPITLLALVALCERAWGKPLPIEFGARPYRAREVMQPWQGIPLPQWKPEKNLLTFLQDLGSD